VDFPEERTGTLILRVWVEDDRPDRLRVRIIRADGPHHANPLAVSTIDDVCAAVRSWLEELLTPDR
jgi:hypothetical protein